MAVNINLLPVELSAKGGVAQAASAIKKVNMAIVIVFIVLGVIGGGLILYLTFQITNESRANTDLKNRIATLEVAEQQTILVKDRLGKIKTINGAKDAVSSVNVVQTINSSIPPGVVLSDTDIDVSGRVKMGFKVTDSSALVTFLGGLTANENFSKLTIRNFSFNPTNGYLISLEATTK